MENIYIRDVRILEMMEMMEVNIQQQRVPRVIFPRVDPSDFLTDFQELLLSSLLTPPTTLHYLHPPSNNSSPPLY